MQSTLDKLTSIITEPDEMVDPTLILAWADAILNLIRRCRSPESAKAQIRKGGPVSFGQALTIVHDRTDLRGRPARMKARELMEAGAKLTDEELADLVEDAQDIPAPIPRGGIFQLLWLIGAMLLAASTAHAQPAGMFQIDVEQNRRLDVIEQRLDDVLTTLAKTPTAAQQPVTSATARTALVPMSRNVWYEGGRYPSVAHVVAHGCPVWVAHLYRNDSVTLGRIHGGYHERSPAVLVTEASSSTVAQPSRVVAGAACPNGVCPTPQRRGMRLFR